MFKSHLGSHPLVGSSSIGSNGSLNSISHTPGQKAAIRFFDPNSSYDLGVIREILKGRQAKKWMDDTATLTVSDYRDWAGTENKLSFLFAVLDATKSLEVVNQDLNGFVFIYSEREEKYRVRRMEKAGLILSSANERFMLEVSFAVRPQADGTQAGSGLMSSALRQSCLQVELLLASGKPDLVEIFAFIDPDNLPAKRTLEASGFEHKGNMRYDSDSLDQSELYLLNWGVLYQRVKDRLLEVI